MKERLTYIVDQQSGFDPDKVEVSKDGVFVTQASKASGFQYRAAAAYDELPQQLATDLRSLGDVHLRWISQKPFDSKGPFTSRLPPGLHVFYTQPNGAPADDTDRNDVCRLVVRLFGWKLDCDTREKSFTILPALPEYGSDPLHQFHYEVDSTFHTQLYLVRQLCKTDVLCTAKVSTLSAASYFDIDFVRETNTATFTSYYERAPELAGEFMDSPTDGNRLEVGILTQENADTNGEVKMGGYLVDVGADKKLTNTRFSIPSRHLDPLKSSSISFEQPTGLHPKMALTLKGSSLTSPSDTCTLHAYFTLPSSIFVDRYQFSDPLFLSSQNLVALKSLSGEDDLEAPDWVVSKWGSAALFELATPNPTTPTKEWKITIPMHLRYVTPGYKSNNTDFVDINVPHPSIFWACQLLDEEDRLDTNPFDRTFLGYDRLFSSNTSFYPIIPARTVSTLSEKEAGILMATVRAPVLDPQAKQWVPSGTLYAVVIGFAWVCWQLLRPKGKTTSKKKLSKPPGKTN